MEKRIKNAFCILAILLLLLGSASVASADEPLESLFVRGDEYTPSAVMVANYVLTPEMKNG